MKFWSAAAYLRMSKSIEEDPANALDVQLGIIQEYIETDGDIELCCVKSDNGYSGLNFNRPAYQEMMEEVKAGRINCIIVKDLSRFSRHHLDSCDMILNKFREAKIRFIAVLDGLDSLSINDNRRDIYIPLRTLMNQAYSMELSKKIYWHLRLKWECGKYTGAQPMYGYKRSPENWYRLIIDEPAADVIRHMFQWRLEGLSNERIAKKLNSMSIPSPAEYKNAAGHPHTTSFQTKETAQWYAGTVIRILRNPVYIGTLEREKRILTRYIRNCQNGFPNASGSLKRAFTKPLCKEMFLKQWEGCYGQIADVLLLRRSSIRFPASHAADRAATHWPDEPLANTNITSVPM